MKKLLIGLTLLVSMSSFADTSLDSLYDRQIKVTISPVQVDGKYLNGSIHHLKDNASAVCGSLGFLRVVEAERERCESSDSLYYMESTLGNSAQYLSRYSSGCGSNSGQEMRIKSITCAK